MDERSRFKGEDSDISTADAVSFFGFRQEGIMIQFNVNRISAVRRIELLRNSESLDQTPDLQSMVKTEHDI